MTCVAPCNGPSPPQGMEPGCSPSAWVADVFEDHFIVQDGSKYYSQGYSIGEDGKVKLEGERTETQRKTIWLARSIAEKRVMLLYNEQERFTSGGGGGGGGGGVATPTLPLTSNKRAPTTRR